MNSLKAVIKEKGVSYKRIAEVLKINRVTLYRKMKNDSLSEKELETIASFLNVPINLLEANDD